jgi:hypothetical protein
LEIQRAATRAIGNLCFNLSSAAHLVAEGVLDALLTALSSLDYMCQCYAALGFSNLTTVSELRPDILLHGSLPSLMTLFDNANVDVESKRYTISTLANLTASVSDHSSFEKYICIPKFVEFFGHNDVQIRNAAVLALSNFASNSDYHLAIVKTGVLPKIFAALGSIDEDLQLWSISLLRGVSTGPQLRQTLVAMSSLDAIIPLFHASNPDISSQAFMYLCNLAVSGYLADQSNDLLSRVSVHQLLDYLKSKEAPKRLFAILALGNISSHTQFHQSILVENCLQALIETASLAADDEVKRCIAMYVTPEHCLVVLLKDYSLISLKPRLK